MFIETTGADGQQLCFDLRDEGDWVRGFGEEIERGGFVEGIGRGGLREGVWRGDSARDIQSPVSFAELEYSTRFIGEIV
jgi:hypothetical protein